MARKILTILRHAKAETGNAYLDDHDRALNERGVQAALAMGNYMARQHMLFDKVLCSTSKRTRQTLENLHLQPEPEQELSDRLYLASANEALQLIRETDNDVGQLLVIGHNPGLQQLCLKLAQSGDEELIDRLSMKFPTCAVAVFDVGENWQEAGTEKNALLGFLTPKILAMQEEE